MPHWIFAFGPDTHKAVKAAELIALRTRKGNGMIVSGSMPDIHVDDLPQNSVVIRPVYSHLYANFAFNEATLEEYVLDFYGEEPTEGSAVIDRDLVLHLPEKVTQDEVTKLVILAVPNDQTTRRIRWGLDLYYPTMTAKKLSGKKFNLKD